MRVGVDLVALPRIQLLSKKRYFERFVGRILSKSEISEVLQAKDQVRALAKHFAVKEAFVKALGTGWADGVRFVDIVVKKNGTTRQIELTGRVSQMAAELGINSWALSISDDGDYVVAVVIMD